MFYLSTRCIALGIFFISVSVFGAVPENIGYQGFLTSDDGAARDDEYLITFSIYSVEEGGSPIWSDTTLVDVDSGLFSVKLGRAANPFPVGLFDTPLWLGVSVESDMEMTPRRELSSAGFSLKAEDANSLQGMTPASLDQSEHVSSTQNPHAVTAPQIGAASEAALVAHASSTANPHAVTAADTGAASINRINLRGFSGRTGPVGSPITAYRSDTAMCPGTDHRQSVPNRYRHAGSFALNLLGRDTVGVALNLPIGYAQA